MQSEQPTLIERQSALIDKIWSSIDGVAVAETDPDKKGISIYQNNLLMTSARALAINYPVLEKMLGEGTMRLLNRHLLKVELPASGDWADYGKALPELITTTPLQDDHPYLHDVAQLERCLHHAARSCKTELEVESLAQLSEVELDNIYIHLADGLSVMPAQYQVDELWRLHQFDSEMGEAEQKKLYELLSQEEQNHYFVVYQKEHFPCIKLLTEEGFNWLSAIINGHHLSALLELYPDFDFSQWLTQAIEEQWLVKLDSLPMPNNL